jgi:hypothetical protein
MAGSMENIDLDLQAELEKEETFSPEDEEWHPDTLQEPVWKTIVSTHFLLV